MCRKIEAYENVGSYMNIPYQTFIFHIAFQVPIRFSVFPPVVLRSILGKELHRLSCVFKGRRCTECSLKYSCAYAVVFETHVEKNTQYLQGRDRASHPFVFTISDSFAEKVDSIKLCFTLIGKGVDYLPYIYYALLRAGKQGIFRERVRFIIQDVTCEGISILEGQEKIAAKPIIRKWSLEPAAHAVSKRIRIDFMTPFRLKVKGVYTSSFLYSDVLTALGRRALLLASLYGDTSGANGLPFDGKGEKVKCVQDIRWVDVDYYSARQKERLRMGGAVGFVEYEGEFDEEELSLLRFGELFHVGKNVSFGLGSMKVRDLTRQ